MRKVRKTNRSVFVLLLFLVSAACASGQEETLRRGFRDLILGVSFSEAQEILGRDNAFAYRGEPDLSMALSSSEAVIDSPGRGFIDRVLLQFNDNALYIITLYLDRGYLDYFLLFEQLTSRYGAADELSPRWARWEDGATRIELERPLSVRYVDLAVLDGIRGNQQILQAVGEQERDDFLSEF